jgi:Holliday junction resolvasome RuvABC DNA-binding subunit
MGFREAEVRQALDKASEHAQSNDLEELLRTALGLLAPVATTG